MRIPCRQQGQPNADAVLVANSELTNQKQHMVDLYKLLPGCLQCFHSRGVARNKLEVFPTPLFRVEEMPAASTHPKSHCMGYAKLGHVASPKRLEVVRHAYLASSTGQNRTVFGYHGQSRERKRAKEWLHVTERINAGTNTLARRLVRRSLKYLETLRSISCVFETMEVGCEEEFLRGEKLDRFQMWHLVSLMFRATSDNSASAARPLTLGFLMCTTQQRRHECVQFSCTSKLAGVGF